MRCTLDTGFCWHLLPPPGAPVSPSGKAPTHALWGKVPLPLWELSTSPPPKARPSHGLEPVFTPGVGRDATPIILAELRESVGQGWFHLQVTLRVFDAHKALEGCTEPLTPPAPNICQRPLLPQPPNPARPKIHPVPPGCSTFNGQGEDMGLGDDPGSWGGEQGAAGSGQNGCTPNPPARSPARMSPQYRTSLTAVLRPDLAPSPSSSWQCPAGPGLPFISCPLSPPQGEEKNPAGAAGIPPQPPPPALGTATRRALSSLVPCSFRVLLPQPSPSRAGAKPCLVLGWHRGCQAVPRGKDGHDCSKPPHGHKGAGSTAKGTACTKGQQDHGVTLNSATHAQGPGGATSAASVTPQTKRWVPAPHPWCAGAPCPTGCHPRGHAVLPHSATVPLGLRLAPRQVPGVQPCAPCPALHLGGLWGISAPLGNHSTGEFLPPHRPNKRSSPLQPHTDISANI